MKQMTPAAVEREMKLQDVMLRFAECAEHRQSFFRIRWVDYDTLCQGSLRLVPPEDQLKNWRLDYQAMAEEMFFGEVRAFDDIIRIVADFERTFNQGAK